MSFGADDMTPFLTPPPSQQLRFGQATILSWDPETFENAVDWRGITFQDLPVLAGPDALSFRAGDTVALLGWGTAAAAGSWWILGRVIVPGAGKAADTIAWMASEVGRAVAAAVFADRIHVDTVQDQSQITDTSYVPLSPPGPTLTGVDVVSGKALVFMSAEIQMVIGSGPQLSGGFVAVDVSGATTVGPDDTRAMFAQTGNSSSDTGLTNWIRTTTVIEMSNLNPGLHNFQLVYKSASGITQVGFRRRSMTVMAS